MPLLTRHGTTRMKERCDVNKNKQVKKLAEKAFKKGLKHSEVTGKLKNYMSYLYFRNNKATNVRLWKGKAYLFDNKYRLITVLNIPKAHLRDVETQLIEKWGPGYKSRYINKRRNSSENVNYKQQKLV